MMKMYCGKQLFCLFIHESLISVAISLWYCKFNVKIRAGGRVEFRNFVFQNNGDQSEPKMFFNLKYF